MIKEVHIKLVPLSTIRNNDVGDYFWEGDSLFINVVDLPEYSHSMLIAIHELIEAFMTDYQGIKEEDINKFDALYDAERVGGLHADEEPGFDASILDMIPEMNCSEAGGLASLNRLGPIASTATAN